MFIKILWVFLEKGSVMLIQFVSLIVLGRLLTPEDYGTYGIMMVFIALSDTLIDSGFGGALVQKKEITKEDINTLFFVNGIISLFLYFLVFVIAPFLEDLYEICNLTIYFRVIGLVLLSHAISIVQNALIIRNLQFRKSAMINFTACLSSFGIAILLAYYGFGVWALISQVVLQSVIATLLLWYKSAVSVKLQFSKSSFFVFWNFGSNLLGANILQTLVNNISNSIIPRIGTLHQSGLYFQATKLNNVPIGILTTSIDKSMFPILSREQYISRIVSKARVLNRYFFIFIIPIFPLLSFCSTSIITLTLGEKWVAAGVYFAIIVWSGIAMLVQVLYRNILKSTGLTRYIFYVEIVKSIVILTIIFVSMQFGVSFLVYGVAISSYIGAFIWALCVKKKTGFSLLDQIKDFYLPFSLSVCIFCLLALIPNVHTDSHPIIFSILGYVLYLFCLLIIRNKELFGSLSIIQKFLSNRVD